MTTYTRSARRALSPLEHVLLAIGAVCLGWFGLVSLEARFVAAGLPSAPPGVVAWVAEDATMTPPSPTARGSDAVAPVVVEPGAVVARIETGRVSAAVLGGTSSRVLRIGAGLVEGSVWPPPLGNVSIAGHRDSFFRGLAATQPGDEVRLSTSTGTFRYIVERAFVVEPTDTWVLDPTPVPSLTLVTCYPFTAVGPAPKRYIVRATLVGSTEN